MESQQQQQQSSQGFQIWFVALFSVGEGRKNISIRTQERAGQICNLGFLPFVFGVSFLSIKTFYCFVLLVAVISVASACSLPATQMVLIQFTTIVEVDILQSLNQKKIIFKKCFPTILGYY